MKGIIFTEFIELVETAFSIETAEDMLELADPASGGAYTAVGNYDHMELVGMVGHLSTLTGVSVGELVMTFGEHLFNRFTQLYPQMFIGKETVYDFVESVEGVIHVEVRKLYPDAELPTISTERTDDGALDMTYRSPRQLGDIAHALLSGCIKHYKEDLTIRRHDVVDETGPSVRFRLQPAHSEELAWTT